MNCDVCGGTIPEGRLLCGCSHQDKCPTCGQPGEGRKVIEIDYYRQRVYGKDLEYVKDPAVAGILIGLTGKRTIDGRVRELLRDLTQGGIAWKEVIAL